MNTEKLFSENTSDELYAIINPENIEDEDELYELVEKFLENAGIADNGTIASRIFDYIMQY